MVVTSCDSEEEGRDTVRVSYVKDKVRKKVGGCHVFVLGYISYQSPK